jgi:hypothetical protein
VVWGIRQRLLLNEQGSLLSLEFSGGLGYGIRFGRTFNQNKAYYISTCEGLDRSPMRPLHSENVLAHFLALPVNLKIGYSWGG